MVDEAWDTIVGRSGSGVAVAVTFDSTTSSPSMGVWSALSGFDRIPASSSRSPPSTDIGEGERDTTEIAAVWSSTGTSSVKASSSITVSSTSIVIVSTSIEPRSGLAHSRNALSLPSGTHQ